MGARKYECRCGGLLPALLPTLDPADCGGAWAPRVRHVEPRRRHETPMRMDASPESGADPLPDSSPRREEVTPTLNVLLCLPAAKVSEPRIACYQQMPPHGWPLSATKRGCQRTISLGCAAWRLPYVGAHDRWTASLSWLRGLDTIDPGPVDCVLSMEMYSVATFQALRLARRLGVPHVVTIAEVLSRPPITAFHRGDRSVGRSVPRRTHSSAALS